ncbi:MAG: hypothetical protein RL398_3555, partial [Planctomycetota bacterium]
MTATETPPAPAAPDAARALDRARGALAELRRKARGGLRLEGLAILCALAVAFAVPSFVTDRLLRLEVGYRIALLASFVVVAVRLLWVRVLTPLRVELDDRELALAVERRSPELREALISSLNFEARLAQGVAGADSQEMMRAVVADVGGRIAAIPFAAALDSRRVRRSATIVALAAAVFASWGLLHGSSLRLWAMRNVLLADVDWPRATALAFADGNREIRLPQGDAVTIAVRADGEAPDQVFLTMRFASGEESVEAMSRNVDGLYTLTVERVLEDASVTAEGGDALPIELRLTVVERPRVDELSLRIAYPAYMERDPEDVPATQGELRLPAGAALTIAGRSQKPLTDAFVLLGDDRRSALTVAADGMSFVGEVRP